MERISSDNILKSFQPTVEAFYATTPRLDHIDRLVFEQPISSFMKLPIKRLKALIRQKHSFLRQAISRSKRWEKISTSAMKKFFQPRQQQEIPTKTPK
jgi:hypothetical protein